MLKTLLALAFLALSIVGCSTVPVSVTMPQNHPALNLDIEKTKLPYDIGLVLPASFADFMLKSSTSVPNIDYNFQYDIGNDFFKTLPEFFNQRFEKVTVVESLENSDKFDYIFIPNITSSRLHTNIGKASPAPSYALEINLEIVTNKNGLLHSSTKIQEAIERDTEVGCWTCWGESILNQQKIKDEYASLLAKIYTRLDVFLQSNFQK